MSYPPPPGQPHDPLGKPGQQPPPPPPPAPGGYPGGGGPTQVLPPGGFAPQGPPPQPGYGAPQPGGYPAQPGYPAQQGYGAPQQGGYGAPQGSGKIGLDQPEVTIWLLGLVTCGIYLLYWAYKTGEDLQARTGKGQGGLVTMLLHLVIVGPFLLAEGIGEAQQARGWPKTISWQTALWLFVPIVGWLLFFQKVEPALRQLS
jgi:hypothetical protein